MLSVTWKLRFLTKRRGIHLDIVDSLSMVCAWEASGIAQPLRNRTSNGLYVEVSAARLIYTHPRFEELVR